ncbi:MAG: leucine-rich repeat domain-containing protein, partial [Bacteroidales bacterium]|nr:leucine-rich repeat domain-containing protein [Bacteroidales bacterium]
WHDMVSYTVENNKQDNSAAIKFGKSIDYITDGYIFRFDSRRSDYDALEDFVDGDKLVAFGAKENISPDFVPGSQILSSYFENGNCLIFNEIQRPQGTYVNSTDEFAKAIYFEEKKIKINEFIQNLISAKEAVRGVESEGPNPVDMFIFEDETHAWISCCNVMCKMKYTINDWGVMYLYNGNDALCGVVTFDFDKDVTTHTTYCNLFDIQDLEIHDLAIHLGVCLDRLLEAEKYGPFNIVVHQCTDNSLPDLSKLWSKYCESGYSGPTRKYDEIKFNLSFDESDCQITQIGDYMFDQCRSLLSIKLPSTVTRIGQYAFQNCENLTSIQWPENLAEVGSWPFVGCTNMKDFSGIKTLTRWAEQGILVGTGVEECVFPDAMEGELQSWMFGVCNNIVDAVIPARFTELGACCFAQCKNLKSITLLNQEQVVSNVNNFSTSGIDAVTIYVPAQMLDQYELYYNANGKQLNFAAIAQ